MAVPQLTWSATRCLFAGEWAAPPSGGWALHVPGAKVDGPSTAANLLNIALWNLHRQGVFEFEQLRPVEHERVVVLGGKPFARAVFQDPKVDLRGLEGALLKAARSDHDDGVRRLVGRLPLRSGGPWATVAGHCHAELQAAGLIQLKGFFIKKPLITDRAAVESLRPLDADVVAQRDAMQAGAADLDQAVISDCLRALHWAYQPTRG